MNNPLLTLEELPRQYEHINEQMPESVAGVLYLVEEVEKAEIVLERAVVIRNGQLLAINSFIKKFNNARIENFLVVMAKDGMIWDSFEKKFLSASPEDETFYAVECKIGERLDQDDFEESLFLHQTPNQETRDYKCGAWPAIGCVVPVILDSDCPSRTVPDDRYKRWPMIHMYREKEAKQELSKLYRVYPSEIPAELAEKYGIPPAIDLVDIKDLEQATD